MKDSELFIVANLSSFMRRGARMGHGSSPFPGSFVAKRMLWERMRRAMRDAARGIFMLG